MNKKIRERNCEDVDEKLFWKVWENDIIRDKIFNVISLTPFYGYSMCDFYFCNRIKFKFIKSCSWMLEKDQLPLLKCKLNSKELSSIRWGRSNIDLVLSKCNNYICHENFSIENPFCGDINDGNSSCCSDDDDDDDDDSDSDSDNYNFDSDSDNDSDSEQHHHNHEHESHGHHNDDGDDSCCDDIQEDDINEERYCSSINSKWNQELISLIYKRFNDHLKNIDLLYKSVAFNNLSALKSFTEDFNIKFNNINNEESKSMKLAIKNNNIDIIKYLCEKRKVKFPFNKKMLFEINQGKVTNSILNFIIENPNLTYKRIDNDNDKKTQKKPYKILKLPFIKFESIECYSIEIQKKLLELKLVKLNKYFINIKLIMNYFKRKYEKNQCYKPSELLMEMVESKFTDQQISKSIKGNPFLLSCFYNRLNDRHYYDQKKNSTKFKILSFFDEFVSIIGKTFETLENDKKNNYNSSNQIILSTTIIPNFFTSEKYTLNYFINNYDYLSSIELFNYGEIKNACYKFTEIEIISNQGLSEKQISKLIKFYEFDIVLEYLKKLLKSNTIDIGKLISYAQNACRMDILEYLQNEKTLLLKKM